MPSKKKNSPAKEPRGPGRPRFAPTDAQRQNVKTMIGFGVPHERICAGLPNPDTGTPITRETFTSAFAAEIAAGTAEMDAMVATSHALKIKEGNMTAIVWYQKNRWGWRDQPAEAPPIDHPINVIKVPMPAQSAEEWQREVDAWRSRQVLITSNTQSKMN